MAGASHCNNQNGMGGDMSDSHDIEMRAWADLAQKCQRELAEARAELRKLQERGGLVYAPYAACDDERRLLREQLAEARAALRDAEFHIAEWSPTVHAEAWAIEHAAALKAAREEK